MVFIYVFGIECGSAGDAVVLRAERIYEGSAGSKVADIERDWKPDKSAVAAAKSALGGTKMWRSAFKVTRHTSSRENGGPGPPAALLQKLDAALAVLEKHGIAGSLKNSWASSESSGAADA